MKRYELPPLPYPYNALEPYISEEIVKVHHLRHHQGYVNGANSALEKLERHLRGEIQIDVRAVLRDFTFNYGGHVFHTLYWYNMAPAGKGGGRPGGRIADAIDRVFGSFEKFRELFSVAAKNVEGVGWAVLGYDVLTDELRIYQVEKHNVLQPGHIIPILVLDVFEHAYYLQYKNDRSSYVDNWWNIVNWDDVEKRLERVLNRGKEIFLLY